MDSRILDSSRLRATSTPGTKLSNDPYSLKDTIWLQFTPTTSAIAVRMTVNPAYCAKWYIYTEMGCSPMLDTIVSTNMTSQRGASPMLSSDDDKY